MIDITTLVNDKNEIDISKKYWKELNDNYSKDEIKQALSDAIEQLNVPVPYREITKEERDEDFQKLIDLDTRELFCNGNVFSRYEYSFQMSKWYIDLSNVGSKSSDYFHQQTRWKADSINAPSPYRTWTTERFRLTLFNALWSLKYDEVNSKNLRSAIGLRKYIAGQFRPSAAKAMYELFEPSATLDPSAGWGDRLSAFMAYATKKRQSTGSLYDGCDPNKSINYFEQTSELKNSQKCFTMIEHVPFEDKILTLPKTDFVFTSPPYFNIEKYSKDPEQSYLKNKKFDDWLKWFLEDYIEKAWDTLSYGKYMAINISDVYSGHKVNHICDPMNEYLNSKADACYKGTIGLRMPKRPNSKSSKDGIFVEPIWIWKKQTMSFKSKSSTQDLDTLITKFLTKNL